MYKVTYEGCPAKGSQDVCEELSLEDSSGLTAQLTAEAFLADKATSISDTDLGYKISIEA